MNVTETKRSVGVTIISIIQMAIGLSGIIGVFPNLRNFESFTEFIFIFLIFLIPILIFILGILTFKRKSIAWIGNIIVNPFLFFFSEFSLLPMLAWISELVGEETSGEFLHNLLHSIPHRLHPPVIIAILCLNTFYFTRHKVRREFLERNPERSEG